MTGIPMPTWHPIELIVGAAMVLRLLLVLILLIRDKVTQQGTTKP